MTEQCVAPNVEHQIEFVIAAFGACTFQCILCNLYFEELEDSQP